LVKKLTKASLVFLFLQKDKYNNKANPFKEKNNKANRWLTSWLNNKTSLTHKKITKICKK